MSQPERQASGPRRRQPTRAQERPARRERETTRTRDGGDDCCCNSLEIYVDEVKVVERTGHSGTADHVTGAAWDPDGSGSAEQFPDKLPYYKKVDTGEHMAIDRLLATLTPTQAGCKVKFRRRLVFWQIPTLYLSDLEKAFTDLTQSVANLAGTVAVAKAKLAQGLGLTQQEQDALDQVAKAGGDFVKAAIKGASILGGGEAELMEEFDLNISGSLACKASIESLLPPGHFSVQEQPDHSSAKVTKDIKAHNGEWQVNFTLKRDCPSS